MTKPFKTYFGGKEADDPLPQNYLSVHGDFLRLARADPFEIRAFMF